MTASSSTFEPCQTPFRKCRPSQNQATKTHGAPINEHYPPDASVSRTAASALSIPQGSTDLIPVFDIEVIKSTYLDGDDNQYNKGLSNGLVGTEKDDEFTRDRVYYDFFELKASMDALANRADKIQEAIIGLLSIKVSQSSSMLSWIGFVFSLVITPFTIVCGLFSIDLDEGQFPRRRLSGWDGVSLCCTWRLPHRSIAVFRSEVL